MDGLDYSIMSITYRDKAIFFWANCVSFCLSMEPFCVCDWLSTDAISAEVKHPSWLAELPRCGEPKQASGPISLSLNSRCGHQTSVCL